MGYFDGKVAIITGAARGLGYDYVKFFLQDTEASQRHYSPEAFEELVQQGMIKRAGTSRDMYGCMRYLCSEDAAWVTGQTLYVNGGSMSRF